MDSVTQQEHLVRVFGVVNAYDEDENLFVISPDRIGFGVIGVPLAGFNSATMDAMNALLNLAYPPNALLQVALYAAPDIEETLYQFRTMREQERSPVLQEVSRRRVEFLRELTQRPIGQVAGARLRQLRLVITVHLPHGVLPPTSAEMARYRELRHAFLAAVKVVGLSCEPLTANLYMRFMETVLNHNPAADWRSMPWSQHENDRLLCNQLLDLDTGIEVEDGQLRLGDHAVVRVLSPKRYPDFVFPGMAMRYLGDAMKGAKALRDPALFTVNVLYPNHESARGRVTSDCTWAQRQASGRLARYIPEYGQRATALEEAVASINAGNRLARVYFGCAVFSPDADAAMQSSMELQGMFRELGFQMMQDRYIVLPLFCQLLPFAAEAEVEKSLMRYRLVTTKHVAPLLPVMGSWRGTGTPLLTLIARDGQLMPFSPYNSDGNYNMVIAAQSGMGKSYLANNMITNFLTVGGRAWVIDRGFSYRKQCEMLGGQYIEFRDDTPLCMNPFPVVRNFSDEVDILSSLLAVMAAPKAGLDDFQASAVTRVLTEQWALKGHDLLIDDVSAALLKEDDKRIQDIGNQLFAFTTKGQYGRYFNGPNTVDLSNRLVVLELQELSGRPHLQRLVLMQLMYQIQQQMDLSPRDMAKLLLVDESWELIASGETQTFIVRWYRQLRKFGACAALCTQSVNDLYVNPGSIAIVENSAHQLLLGQKAESIAAVRREGRLQMSEGEFKLLESVHTVPGEYSEIFVRNAFGSGVGRLVESPFNNLLYSTHPADVAALEQYRHAGLPQVEAINRVLRDREGKHAA